MTRDTHLHGLHDGSDASDFHAKHAAASSLGFRAWSRRRGLAMATYLECLTITNNSRCGYQFAIAKISHVLLQA